MALLCRVIAAEILFRAILFEAYDPNLMQFLWYREGRVRDVQKPAARVCPEGRSYASYI